MSDHVRVYLKDAETGADLQTLWGNGSVTLDPSKTYLLHPAYDDGFWMVDAIGRTDTLVNAGAICSPTPGVTATQPVVEGGAGPRSSGSLPSGRLVLGLFLFVVGGVGFFKKRRA